MAGWIYFLHPPRENFAATMTDAERAAFVLHLEHLKGLLADGVLVLAGPTLGALNTGVAVFEAPDEQAARTIMDRSRHQQRLRSRRTAPVPRHIAARARLNRPPSPIRPARDSCTTLARSARSPSARR